MSHVTAVKTRLKDGKVLRKALEKLGYCVCDGGLKTGLPGRSRHLELSANKDGFWIGFRRRRGDEAYEMHADWEGRRLGREKTIAEIHQVYSREKILDYAGAKGYMVAKNRVNEKGQIEIILRKLGS